MTKRRGDRRSSTEVGVAGPSWGPESWLVGVVLAVLVIGPGLGPGSLLNLDLLVTPEIPIPNGIFGLGPRLSQRTPFFVLFGIGSWLVGGPLATKVLLVFLLAAGYVGMSRLVGRAAGRMPALAAGVFWAAGPFTVTRLGVGHLSYVWLIAVLPWIVRPLLHPSVDWRRTVLAALAMAFGGPAVGLVGLVVLAVGLASEPRAECRVVRGVAIAGATSLLWVAPTIVLWWAGAEVGGAADFSTAAHGVDGWLGLLVGGGFWNDIQQVGGVGWTGAVGGVAIAVLALLGYRDLPAWAAPLRWVAVVGLTVTLASAVPGIRDVYGWFTDLSVGAPFRESQRFLVLWLLWAAPAAALGGRRLGERLVGLASSSVGPGFRQLAVALPLAAVVAVAVPGLWGIGGRLQPVRFPTGWTEARDLMRDRPGPAVAFPWNEYPPLSFVDGRHVFNPVPDFVGGDVISSYDPLFDPSEPRQEQVDRRAWVVDDLSRDIIDGGQIGSDLADLGIRWVILVREEGWGRYAHLGTDPDLTLVIDNPDVVVYEVDEWSGVVEAPTAGPYRFDRPVPPLIMTDAPAGAVLNVAGAPGWVRGWFGPVRVTKDGRLQLGDAGSEVVWFWPAVVLLGINLLVAAVATRLTSEVLRQRCKGK